MLNNFTQIPGHRLRFIMNNYQLSKRTNIVAVASNNGESSEAEQSEYLYDIDNIW